MSGAVVVTGAGGPAGVAVIRALSGAGHHVVAADADPNAVGLRLGAVGRTLPRCDTPEFAAEVVALCSATGATALISTVAEELVALAAVQPALAAAGVATWLPDPGAVQRCVDKWAFAETLRDAGSPAPATALGERGSVPGPWIVKPRFGRGSRDVYPCDTEDDLRWALAHTPDPIVQTRLSGREFTADALVDRDGRLQGCVPRWRLETKAGISTKGRTFEHAKLVEATGALLGVVGLTGPANVQGFVAEDGGVAFTEVNPRFSGGLPLSLAAGSDLVGEYLRGVHAEPLRPERLRFRPGVLMLRYFDEVYEDAGDDAG